MIMPLLGLLDPSRGAFLWGAWGYTVTFLLSISEMTDS